MEPRNIKNAIAEGRRLLDAGKPGDAAERFLSVVLHHPGHAEANYRLAGALAKQGKATEAITYMERAVAAEPDNPGLLTRLGQIYASARRARDAVGAYNKVLSRKGMGAWALQALVGRGIVLAQTEQFEQAIADLTRATKIDPKQSVAWHNLGNALFRTEQQGAAVDAFRKAAALTPDNPMILYSLGRALVWAGAFEESIGHLDQALRRAPDQLQILSYKILALRHAGRADEADDLEGINDMILATITEPPPGYADHAEWNEALHDDIVNHPALTTGIKYRATRNGAKVVGMFAENKTPVFEAFEQQIRGAFEDTLARMPRKKGHPLPLTAPHGYYPDMWANVMYDGGHQIPHNHPKGWFSACYYNVLPDRVTQSGDAHEGWIEFGGTAYDFPEPPGAPKRQIRPEPGMLVVFPSYVFHRTIPFHSDQVRISCAFDAMPLQPDGSRS